MVEDLTELLPKIHHSPVFYREQFKALTLTLHLIVLFLKLQHSWLHKKWLNDSTVSLTLTRTDSLKLIRRGLLLIISPCCGLGLVGTRVPVAASHGLCSNNSESWSLWRHTWAPLCVCEREREGRKAPRLCEKKGIMLHWKLIYACHVQNTAFCMRWNDG